MLVPLYHACEYALCTFYDQSLVIWNNFKCGCSMMVEVIWHYLGGFVLREAEKTASEHDFLCCDSRNNGANLILRTYKQWKINM